jgi:hypothetical protein
MHMRKIFLLVLLAALATTLAFPVAAQVRYSRGQDVQPAFEGWQKNADGTYNLYFGYFNRNFEEVLDIPIGPENSFDGGQLDRGQPTHFYPRRQMFVFKVVLSKDWDPARRLTWTIVSHGHTDHAKGWLQPQWEVDDGVISENVGHGLSVGGNRAPSISGDTSQTIRLPETAKLTVSATDDGLPKPPTKGPEPLDPNDPVAAAAREGRRPPGVGVHWIQYRGPGSVQFEPEDEKPVYGKPITASTVVTFSAPGTYVIRAVASDGALFAPHDITVVVKAAGDAK